MDNPIETGPDQNEPLLGSLKERIIQTLNEHGLSLDTDFKDQHFLVSEEAVKSLIDAADLSSNDSVLEIGPGVGQITEELGHRAGSVYAIEIDDRFRSILDAVKAKTGNIEIAYANALDAQWPRSDKLVANIPFSILEPLIGRIIREKSIQICSLVVGKNYYLRNTDTRLPLSRTALLTQAFFDLQLACELKQEDFYPRSDERAVIVTLARKDKKDRDFGLTTLANRVLSHPNQKVWGLLADVINESYDFRREDPHQVPTVESLGLPDFLLNKALREIDNTDIDALARVLRRFDRSGRSKRIWAEKQRDRRKR